MGGLNTSLTIGIQALEASQAALDTTSNNISNSNTAGYTREVANYTENEESLVGNQVIGGGVTLTGISSIRDELLNLQIQQQTSQQYSSDAVTSGLTSVENTFSSTGNDIATTLSAFSSALNALSANPSSTSAQQEVLTAGQNLAESFNSASASLSNAQSNADSEVTTTVASINSLTTQIAKLNSELAQSNTTQNNGGTLQDQRDEDVQKLSQLTGISVSQSTDGEVITTGNGTPLVMGGTSYSLQTTTGSSGFQQVLDSNGNNITSEISGGTLGGAIKVRDSIVPGFQSTLDTLASQLATKVNSAQAQGYDSTGAVGSAFFTIPSTTTGAAAGIAVALTSGSQVAASSDGSSGSNGNVANLSAALTTNLPSGDTAAEAYASLVYQVGTASSDASSQSSALSTSLLSLTNQQSSVSGVNVDEETTNLIKYQTAYQAAARIISTIQALDTTTINMVS